MLGIRFFVVILEVLTIGKLEHQLNDEIRDKELRVIGSDGSQLGIMSAAQANALAEEQELDLVKISPNAVPPVCKIMDYSKFCFDQKKREKEARGREMAHTNLGEKLLLDFVAECADIATMEKNPKLEGRFMSIFLAPKNSK